MLGVIFFWRAQRDWSQDMKETRLLRNPRGQERKDERSTVTLRHLPLKCSRGRNPEKVDAREESEEKVKVLFKPSLENEVEECGMPPPTPGSHSCSARISQPGHMLLGQRSVSPS